MNGTGLTFIGVVGFFIIVRVFSMFIRRRVRRNRGMGYDGWPGDPGTFGQSGGGHHGHPGGGWGGSDGGGHHGGGGGGGDSGGGGGHHG